MKKNTTQPRTMKQQLLIAMTRNHKLKYELRDEVFARSQELEKLKGREKEAENCYDASVTLLINEHGMSRHELNLITNKQW